MDLIVGVGLLVEVYQYFDVGLFVDEGQLSTKKLHRNQHMN